METTLHIGVHFKSSILVKVLKQRDVFPERRVDLLA